MVILLALIPMFAWGSIGLVSGKSANFGNDVWRAGFRRWNLARHAPGAR